VCQSEITFRFGGANV